jgi:hypothetical protein
MRTGRRGPRSSTARSPDTCRGQGTPGLSTELRGRGAQYAECVLTLRRPLLVARGRTHGDPDAVVLASSRHHALASAPNTGQSDRDVPERIPVERPSAQLAASGTPPQPLVAVLRFQEDHLHRTGISTVRNRAGCCGVTGPVPRPLWMDGTDATSRLGAVDPSTLCRLSSGASARKVWKWNYCYALGSRDDGDIGVRRGQLVVGGNRVRKQEAVSH